jgi:hypothetical protein
MNGTPIEDQLFLLGCYPTGWFWPIPRQDERTFGNDA